MAKDIKILGFNFTKVSAEKAPDFSGDIKLSTNINISSVEKQKLELVKDEALKISFSFTISYGELGKVELSGNMFLLTDSKVLKEALKSWEDKKLPEDLRLSVLNVIMQRSSLRAFQLEEDLGLPLHMPLPRLSVEKNK
jgi:hypothetical protein